MHPAWTIVLNRSANAHNINHSTLLGKKHLSKKEAGHLSRFIEEQHVWDFSDLYAAKIVDPQDLVSTCRACVNEWFGLLYAHPWWEMLAHRVDLEKVKGWVQQNYALSKIAASSSAMAILNDAHNRDFFTQSIIEEFDHHEKFFLRENASLGLTLLSYELPPPLGVEALRHFLAYLAREDELALTIFYYFQECSAYLIRDFKKYYSHLETLYSAEGFFSGWLSHVSEDETLDHGGEVERALEALKSPKPEILNQALERAWFGITLLLTDYDNLAEINPTSSTHDTLSILTTSDLVDVTLVGLSKTTTPQEILEFGAALKLVDSKKSNSEVKNDDWQNSCNAICKALCAENSQVTLAWAKFSVHQENQNDLIILAEYKNLLENIIKRKPPNMLAGGVYKKSNCM